MNGKPDGLPTDFLATEEELRCLMANAQEAVQEILPVQSMPPQLVVLVREEGGKSKVIVAVIDVGFNEPQEKKEVLEGIGAKIQESRAIPVAACLATEAWVAPSNEKNVPPSECPDKKECIVLFGGFVHTQEGLFTSADVKRDRDDLMHFAGDFSPFAKGTPTLLGHLFRGFAQATLLESGKKGLA